MRIFLTGSFLLIAFALLATAEEWSWGKDKNKDEAKSTTETADKANNRESKSIDSYSGVNDDSISQEEGGASVAANDTQPRHLIRDRLCGLGLMEVITVY